MSIEVTPEMAAKWLSANLGASLYSEKEDAAFVAYFRSLLPQPPDHVILGRLKGDSEWRPLRYSGTMGPFTKSDAEQKVAQAQSHGAVWEAVIAVKVPT